MRITRQLTVMLAVVVLGLAALPAGAADFDLKLDVDPGTSNRVKIENAMTQGRDFINHVGIYLRFVPKDTEPFPVFIDTENYLSCEGSDEKLEVNDIKEVHTHETTGIKVYAFFFDKPSCTEPVFHVKAVFGDS